MTPDTYPYVAWAQAPSDDDPGYRVGVALDTLAAWARENGCTLTEWAERCEEAYERASDDE
jgi:hypothetical protein